MVEVAQGDLDRRGLRRTLRDPGDGGRVAGDWARSSMMEALDRRRALRKSYLEIRPHAPCSLSLTYQGHVLVEGEQGDDARLRTLTSPEREFGLPDSAADRYLDVCGEDHIGEGHRPSPERGGAHGGRGQADRGGTLSGIFSLCRMLAGVNHWNPDRPRCPMPDNEMAFRSLAPRAPGNGGPRERSVPSRYWSDRARGATAGPWAGFRPPVSVLPLRYSSSGTLALFRASPVVAGWWGPTLTAQGMHLHAPLPCRLWPTLISKMVHADQATSAYARYLEHS